MYLISLLYYIILLFYGSKFSKKTQFFLCYFPLVLISFLRFGVGADYFSYKHIYMELKLQDFFSVLTYNKGIEPFFKYIMFFFAKLGFSYHIFVALFSSILSFIFLKFLEGNSDNFEASVLLHYSMLFIYWNLSALRQGLVLVVMLFYFFNKKQYSTKFYVVLTLVMSLIHVTAIIVPVFFILSKLKWNRNYFLIALVLSPLSRVFTLTPLVDVLSKLPILGKFSVYINYDFISFFSLPSFMRLFFIALIMVHYNELTTNHPKKGILLNFSLVGLIGYFYLPFAMVVGTRLTIFSFALLPVIIPMIMELYNYSSYRVISYVTVVLISTLSFGNEFMKLGDRTGYLGTLMELNFETIFNGKYQNFDKNSVFYISVLEDSYVSHYPDELIDRSNTSGSDIETYYSENDAYISVKFTNGYYGVINQNGEVLLSPKFPVPVYIYSGYVHITSFVGDIEYSYFRKLPKNLEEVDYYNDNTFTFQEIESIISSDFYSRNSNNMGKFDYHEYSLISIREEMFTSSFNPMPIRVAYEFSYSDNSQYSYIRLMTSIQEYYIVLKDNLPLVERVYKKIEKVDQNNFFVGYTEFAKEYINPDGEIIWVELNK